MRFHTYILFLFVIMSSCAGKISSNQQRAYVDTVYQQFWTADWSPDGKLIAVGGVDSMLRIYQAADLILLNVYPLNSWIHSVKWHPHGNRLAIATLENIRILNQQEKKITNMNIKPGARAIGWNHDGSFLAIGDLDGKIHIANNNGDVVSTSKQLYDPDQPGTSFLSLDWHPARNIFVAANFQIAFFDSRGTELKTMEHRNKKAIILSAAWHPSGEFFVIGDYGHNWEGENVPSLLHFWSADGEYMKAVPGNKAEIRNLSFNKDGSRLATASDVLRIWNNDGQLLHASKRDSTNYLWGISWSPDGRRIVTASRHKTIALWNKKAKLLKRIDLISR